jgi:alkanesulfonate monooxygenase SsuD/methylene tetrahydromethanopterin reductase-like flavin-dependent oxidoreductase (luciferase family)
MREDAPRAAVSTGYDSNRHAACIDVSGRAPIQLAAMSAMVGLRFDLRVPAFAKTTPERQYAACLQMCEWADDRGFDAIAISEHHGVADGYMSSPVTLAAAIAACTKQIRINIAAVLVPLHDPLRLAEQLATAAIIAEGRLSVVVGMGYRPEEFAMAGVDRTQRGKLFDEYVGVLQQAWTGKPFTWRDRTVQVTPAPASPPLLLVGGSTPKAAKRAARLRCGFFPAVRDLELQRIYEEACAATGFTGFTVMPGGPGFVHVTEDPERDWKRIAPYALYDARTYHEWQTPGQRSEVHVDAVTEDDVRRSPAYKVVTPDGCVEIAREHGRVILHPLMGGIEPELGWESLELFASAVVPQIR